jgi:hypothetical protein
MGNIQSWLADPGETNDDEDTPQSAWGMLDDDDDNDDDDDDIMSRTRSRSLFAPSAYMYSDGVEIAHAN